MRRLSISVVGICGLIAGCGTGTESSGESVQVSTTAAQITTDASFAADRQGDDKRHQHDDRHDRHPGTVHTN